jgi:hypothetical protein
LPRPPMLYALSAAISSLLAEPGIVACRASANCKTMTMDSYLIGFVSSPIVRSQPEDTIDVRRVVSKGVEEGRRPPALREGHPGNSCTAVSGVACPQGVEE